MPFSEETVERAKDIAGFQCECRRIACNHSGRCTNTTELEGHHIRPEASGGPSTLENCEVLCRECHQEFHKSHPIH